MGGYYGLIEVLLTFGGVTAFVLWQMRSLKRDIAAREERERREKAEKEQT